MGETARLKATAIATTLRSKGVIVELDHTGRSLKAQMKYADKIGAEFVTVLGDNELIENKAKLKNMSTGEEKEISLDDIISSLC